MGGFVVEYMWQSRHFFAEIIDDLFIACKFFASFFIFVNLKCDREVFNYQLLQTAPEWPHEHTSPKQ
jgi:hypothetical protein